MSDLFTGAHQSKLDPSANKFHVGNGSEGKGTGRHIACFILRNARTA